MSTISGSPRPRAEVVVVPLEEKRRMSQPDKRLLFHVGAHVTGTRQVQRYLRENAEPLRMQGVHYIQRELMSKYVGWGPKVVLDPRPLAREISQAMRSPGIGDVVASHENTIGRPFVEGGGGGLYAGAGPALEAIAALAEPYRCTVVLSVCSQANFLESFYLHTVNGGVWDSFETWLDERSLDDISWLPLHEQLVEIFGADDVRVLDYESVGADAGAYVREFFRLLDLDLPTDHVPPVRLFRHSEKALSVALAANPYLKAPDERAGLRTFLAESFSGRNYAPATLLTAEQRASLEARYRDEYLRVVGHQPVGEVRE
jgi:hypothetical protein